MKSQRIDEQARETAVASSAVEEEVNLLVFSLVVWRHRWLIVGFCLAVLIATVALTAVTPKLYESTTTLLTPKEGSMNLLSGLAVAGLFQQVPGLSPPSLTPNRDMLVSILKSRTVGQGVVDRFGLVARYRSPYFVDALKRLESATRLSASKEGVISVSVEDTDPALAAAMANFYFEQLDRLVAHYGIGEAGRQRAFLSEQLARAKTALDSAERNLRGFQERNRAVALQEQTRGAIEAAARLKGEITAAEVQLQVVRNFATEANPEVVVLKRRIDEMHRQLTQMHYGDGTPLLHMPPVSDRRDFAVPLPKVPEVGLELGRLTREVKEHETLVVLLTQQLEQARIAEARDLPVVQVLDRAVLAERPSRPRLGLNLTIAGVGSLLVSIVFAVFFDYAKSLRANAQRAQV